MTGVIRCNFFWPNRLAFLSLSTLYTHSPGFSMSVELTKLEAHLSTRSYVEG